MTFTDIIHHPLFCRTPLLGSLNRPISPLFVGTIGYYSFFRAALCTFTQNVTICYCAEKRVYPGVDFDHYAVLGNDVVIADSQVALAPSGHSGIIGGSSFKA
ncbi:hypothetical protein B296_00005637 [Ensete ventricosum]|uniref:Uncharacterized protein n=1 Tax=Ensete ventricosum TaxID=4639 RepID=A0A426YGY3_ENSVE|nr:hypothetical protein B296_00005637 [Ensete ventricosum]